jgi:hypothetical protein
MEEKQAEESLVEQKVEENGKRGHRVLVGGLLFLLFLLFALGVSLVLIRSRVIFFGQALEVGQVSYQNSYVFASPLSAQVGGEEKIRVTVFILDTEGRGVEAKSVSLGQHEKLEITPVQSVTDDLGRAIFDIAAFKTADYLIEARLDDHVLPQKVKVRFR